MTAPDARGPWQKSPDSHDPLEKSSDRSIRSLFLTGLGIAAVALVAGAIGYLGQAWYARQQPMMPEAQLQYAERAFETGNNQVALALFTRLADKNNANAEYWLAHMTELGLGVPRDPVKALELYKKAAAQHVVAAEERLGEAYLNGDIVLPDYGQAKTFLDQAAYDGNARAAMLLGQMYRIGLWMTAEGKEAYAWSEVARLEGNTFAQRERDASLRDLSPDDQEAAIARARDILKDIKRETDSATQTTALTKFAGPK
jgi:TPR repeat protein